MSIPYIMKKSFNKNILCLVIISLLLLACDKIPDGVVDVKTVDYQVVLITAPSSFVPTSTDSSVTTSIKVLNTSSVQKVWCCVKTLDQTQTVSENIEMLDNGSTQTNGDQTSRDGIYSCKFVMSKKLSNGNYQIEYYIEDNVRESPDNQVKVGAQVFSYNNNQTNYAPVISDLVMPSSINRGETFTFSVHANDPNGLTDIYMVYFKLYRPDETIVMNGSLDYFLMLDTGNTALGDQTAGDGIYSLMNYFGSTSATGVWRFEFQAIDRNGKLSNIITSNLIVN